MGLDVFLPDIIFEPVSESLWDEEEFLLPATLGISEDQPPVINI
jgi:hypothetical protein